MGHYLVNFAVYAMAMVGVIGISLFVYKKSCFDSTEREKADFLTVENKLNLSPRKSLYIIKAGDEKFLVASDVEQTTFLAKLGGQDLESATNVQFDKKPVLAGISLDEDLRSSGSNVRKMPVMKELVRKLNSQRG